MNYYEARQTKDATGWHFTCMNDGVIWPVGYCADHDPHHSRAEAEQCFQRYLLDEISPVTYSHWQDCERCGAPTKKGLATRRPHGHQYALCDEHRTNEEVKELAGEPITRIVASW